MQKAASPKDYASKKGMPSDGPFDSLNGGKAHPQSSMDKKQAMPMKKKVNASQTSIMTQRKMIFEMLLSKNSPKPGLFF
jgi:hypothetical protein